MPSLSTSEDEIHNAGWLELNQSAPANFTTSTMLPAEPRDSVVVLPPSSGAGITSAGQAEVRIRVEGNPQPSRPHPCACIIGGLRNPCVVCILCFTLVVWVVGALLVLGHFLLRAEHSIPLGEGVDPEDELYAVVPDMAYE